MKLHFLVPIVVFVLLASLPVAAFAGASGPVPYRDLHPAGPPIPTQLVVSPGPEHLTGSDVRAATSARASAGAPDVQTGQPGLVFRYAQTFGETGVPYFADTSHLNFPLGIATDGNNVWITELFGHRALKYASSGEFLASVGQAGSYDGPLGEADDVAVDATGNTWVTSWGDVVKFSPAGEELVRLRRDDDPNTNFGRAAGIAFDSKGNIFVSDGGYWWSRDEGNHRIQVFRPNGDYLATIGTSGTAGSGNLQFHGPHHIAIYQDVLYVADGGNERVQVINVANPLSPAYVATLGTTGEGGSDNAHFRDPFGVAVDASYIYVADRWNGRVQVFTRGTRTYVASITDHGLDAPPYWEPTDVAVDASGNLYVADFVNCVVQRYGPDRQVKGGYGVYGVPYLTDARHYNTPLGVAAAADGSLYVTEDNGHRLIKLDSAGNPLWTVGSAGVKGDWNDAYDRLDNPGDVALDAAGRVYVADQWHGRVQIFNPDGSYFATLDFDETGTDRIWCPGGITIAPDGRVFVADSCAHRVQVFDANLKYQATMGVTNEPGSDNGHFNEPQDVAVDSHGMIYVSDRNNARVQVFNPARSYLRTIGVTGQSGSDFDHLSGPNGLAVDASGRLYIADAWNNRVQIFDAGGKYLTTIGGRWGTNSSQMRGAEGVAVGPNGEVFVADWSNSRIQKFSLGVPGWKQVNINGFGNPLNGYSGGLTSFGGQLYTGNYGNLAGLWRMAADGSWSSVMTGGFGDPSNVGIDHLLEFNGKLYAGTYNVVCDDPNCQTAHSTGGQIWRSGDGQTWDQVVAGGFGDARNWEVQRFAVFRGQLYAGTWSGTADHGLQLWRSATGDRNDWTRVEANGFGDANNAVAPALTAYDNQLYAGTRNGTGGEVWRSPDGSAWTQVNLDGFGSAENRIVEALAPYGGYLYAGTYNANTGGQIWRCVKCDGSDWSRVIADGFGKVDNRAVATLEVAGTRLYAITNNDTGAGTEVWRSSNGVDWEPVAPSGFGDSNNRGPYFGNSVAVHAGRLFIGTTSSANGFEIWTQSLTAGFTATPSRGRPPLTVQFTNTSAGDFTSSQWDFGDGTTSAETNPARTYAQAGKYTVKLTVGDGTETNTVSREAVTVGFPIWLPLIDRGHDPLLYDDFDNAAWDGAWNPAKWTPDQTAAVYRQQSGALVVTEPASSNSTGGTLRSNSPHYRLWRQAQRLEARLKTSSDRTGGYSPIGIAVDVEEVNGHTWGAICQLGAVSNEPRAFLRCSIYTHQLEGDIWREEFGTQTVSMDYDTWCTARIELDSASGAVRFYLNDTLIGSHVPADAAALLNSDRVQMVITDWGQEPNSTGTRYVDWVRITPVK